MRQRLDRHVRIGRSRVPSTTAGVRADLGNRVVDLVDAELRGVSLAFQEAVQISKRSYPAFHSPFGAVVRQKARMKIASRLDIEVLENFLPQRVFSPRGDGQYGRG